MEKYLTEKEKIKLIEDEIKEVLEKIEDLKYHVKILKDELKKYN